MYWPGHMNFKLTLVVALIAVAVNWIRMTRAGSRMRPFKSAALAFGILIALVPGEMIYCQVKPMVPVKSPQPSARLSWNAW